MGLTRVGVSISFMRIERSPFSWLRKQEQGWNFFLSQKNSKKGIAKLGRKDNITSTKIRISLSFKDHQQ